MNSSNYRPPNAYQGQRFPPSPPYSDPRQTSSTSYNGYQPSPAYGPPISSTSYENFRPSPAYGPPISSDGWNTALYRPTTTAPPRPPPPPLPKPPSPYQSQSQNQHFSSFASRRQRSQYASVPDDENYASPPRRRPLPALNNDIELVDSDERSAYSFNATQPSNYDTSVPENIHEYRNAPSEEPDKPMMVMTSAHEISPRSHADSNPYLREADAFLNKAMSAIQAKKLFGWLSPQFFHASAWFGWRPSHSYQPPQHHFDHVHELPAVHVHLDAFRRSYEGFDDDQYLDPLDGRVRKLFVQTIKEIYDTTNDTHWRRTYITDVSPWLLRVAWWSRAGILTAKKDRAVKRGNAFQNTKSRFTSLNNEQWVQLATHWLPACVGLLILMCFPTDIEGQVRNHGFYDPVPYRFWSYPKTARNYYENRDVKSSQNFNHVKDPRLSERFLLPRYLCFLDQQSPENPRGRLPPLEWKTSKSKKQLSYIFISYTGENQFGRPCDDAREEMNLTGVSTCNCPECACSKADADALHQIATIAAQNAGVPAYWTDQCCMSSNKAEFSQDIYGISDVVRGAQSIVVIVGRSGGHALTSEITTKTLLKSWGTRMWTWPEVLLAPVGRKISVYTRGESYSRPREYSKLDFARDVWKDATTARYLIDHYDNSLSLTRLELVVLALECLTERVINGTTPFADGDLSYALMGLLRQRPNVDKNDTAFQAFARLSLANDSDQLLERMICLLPVQCRDESEISDDQQSSRNTGAPLSDEEAKKAARQAVIAAEQKKKHYWSNMDDHWGAKLWDFEPHCQVAGIAANDTVILDGAYGATVHWDSFQRVAITTRETWSRMLGRVSVRMTPVWLLFGIIIVGMSGGVPSTTAIGALFLIISLVLLLLSPILILHIYSGKVWNSQPWLFGLEGHMSLRDIEKKIFGFECDRLNWAPYCSAMSSHRVNTEYIDDECEGTDPFPEGFRMPNSGRTGPTSLLNNGMRLFTIVDTLTMNVTTFYAERPPVVALLCGSEGGMQRAVMCSYDWTTQTLFRETVLRMETRMLERMPRIGRVRFGLKRGEGKP